MITIESESITALKGTVIMRLFKEKASGNMLTMVKPTKSKI
jgi:hypothetical protein